MSSYRPLRFVDASARADEIVANDKLGIGTHSQTSELHIKADAPELRVQDEVSEVTETALRITANSGTVSFQSGTDFTEDSKGDFKFESMHGGTTHMTIDGSTGNVEVGTANLFVDTTTSRVGVGTTEPTESLDIVGNLNLQKVSNTASIKLNSNVVTEFVRSKKFIKYPRVPMTAATTAGYTASASSERDATTYPAYKAFNNIFNSGSYTDGWNNATNTNYDGTDNSYNPSADTPTLNLGIGAVDGEWLKLELPVKVLLQSFKIYARWNDPTRAPEDFRVYGSNDNANWTELLSVSGQQPPATGQEYEIIQTNVHYKYFGLVVTKIWSQNNYFSIDLVEYYGVPEYDPDAHATDVIVRSVPNVPNTDWLEVYWDGQDYTSIPATVTDKSGNGATGTPNGGVGFDTEYKAFTFDGVDDYISGTLSNPAGDWTHSTSFWVKIDTLKNVHFYQIGPETTNYDTTALYYSASGFFQTSISGGGANTRGDASLIRDTWYHIVVVKKANVLDDIYLNSQKLSGSYTSGTQLSLPQNTSIILGDRPADAGVDPLDGSIANFRLFNRALTGDEVWQLYAYQKEYFGHGNLDMTLKSGRLGIGTSEPRAVLDVNGTMHANGAVVQLQTRTFGLSFATTSYTFADTGAYVDITPKFSNSKFFLMFDGLAAIIRASDAAGLGIQAFRSIGGGTDQRVYSAEGLPGAVTSPSDLAFYNANGAYDHARISISFSDTPNTSSRIRYKIYARAHVGGRRADLGNSGHQPLTFTVFEIAQ